MEQMEPNTPSPPPPILPSNPKLQGRLKLTLITATFLPLFTIVRMILSYPARQFIESNQNGLAGLALGLVIVNILLKASILFPLLLIGLFLKAAGFRSVFKVTLYSTLFVFVFFSLLENLSSGSLLLIASSLVVVLTFNFFYWWFEAFPRLHKALKYCLPLLFMIIIYFSTVFLLVVNAEKQEERGISQNVIKQTPPPFQTYGSHKTTGPDVRCLSNNLNIPFASSVLETPKGLINITQTGWDDNLHKLLIPPNRCDHDALVNYISVGGKKKVDGDTSKTCQLLFQSSGGKRMLLRPISNESGNSAPYVAIVDNTVLVFLAYPLAGYFDGRPEEAEKYLWEFVTEATPDYKAFCPI